MSERTHKASRDLKRIGASLAVVALQRLSDPEVRAKLADRARTVAGAAKEWRAERAIRAPAAPAPSGADGPGSALPGEDLRLRSSGLADRFGRRRLQRRIDRLRVSVLSLGEGRPDLAVQLDPVLAALEEVGTALDLAATQSFARRVRAHQRVDAVLDALETGLFEAALPQLPGPSSTDV